MGCLDISRILTISTGHVTDNTARLLDKMVYENALNKPIVCNKRDYGWFIYVPDYFRDMDVPDELKKCMQLARDNECEWLCLDSDGEIMENLEYFEW